MQLELADLQLDHTLMQPSSSPVATIDSVRHTSRLMPFLQYQPKEWSLGSRFLFLNNNMLTNETHSCASSKRAMDLPVSTSVARIE
jgi:hypothetical protein